MSQSASKHTVKRRETLRQIARSYGHEDWKKIYYHPANEEFRRKRPNPNVIFPNDVLYIPDRQLDVPSRPLSDDEFEEALYGLDYRSERGRCSEYLRVKYPNGVEKDIHLDSITPNQPRLWAVKLEAIGAMNEFTFEFMVGAFPAVWMILTASPTMTPVTQLPGVVRPRYTVSMRRIPKPPLAETVKEGAELVSRIRQAGKSVKVNIGGTGEVPEAINLNPNEVAPRTDIPNLIAKKAENIADVFQPNTIDEIVSNNLPPNTIDWTRTLAGSHKVLRPGGTISIRFKGVGSDASVIIQQLRRLGFKQVNNPLNMGVVIEAVK